jgi:hypothetical protein
MTGASNIVRNFGKYAQERDLFKPSLAENNFRQDLCKASPIYF